jgi:hypothetical protein
VGGKDLSRSDCVRREMRREANGLGIVSWIGPGIGSSDVADTDDDEEDAEEDAAERVDGSAEIMCDRINRASGEGANFELIGDVKVWRMIDEPRISVCDNCYYDVTVC